MESTGAAIIPMNAAILSPMGITAARIEHPKKAIGYHHAGIAQNPIIKNMYLAILHTRISICIICAVISGSIKSLFSTRSIEKVKK